jgi:hypothetical protein
MPDGHHTETDVNSLPQSTERVFFTQVSPAPAPSPLRQISLWLITSVIFAVLVGPTFISYEPYQFHWDEAEYVTRAITVSQWYWSGRWSRIDGPIPGMVSVRPPAMTLLGLPWGYLSSWSDVGKCFVTLDIAIAFLAALSFYFLARIGTERSFLGCAAVCLFASLGPYPPGATAHYHSTGFLSDALFAWTACAAVLLIPYEMMTSHATIGRAILRGILWGAILSLGLMTKLNFLYFVVLIAPILFWIRFRRNGMQNALVTVLALGCCMAPSAYYLIRWGQPAFHNLRDSSFGDAAQFYYIPFLQFVNQTFRESPGMLLTVVFMAAALAYLLVKRRLWASRMDLVALGIMAGFAVIVFMATNKQIRYAFPAIVSLPFLIANLLRGKTRAECRSSVAFLSAILVFAGLTLAGLPVRFRPDPQSVSRSDAILAKATECGAHRILLATDSPTLNLFLMELSRVLQGTGRIGSTTLAYSVMTNIPIEKDLERIHESDLVVFQDAAALSPPFTNQRLQQYEQFVKSQGHGPFRISADTSLYFMNSEQLRCRE